MTPLFQSTRPRGARPVQGAKTYEHQAVSIHAPARGATKDWPDLFRQILFQSTRPRGARLSRGQKPMNIKQFQSTRPRGARRPCGRFGGLCMLFQSTRPRGARLGTGVGRYSVILVSIHAPARGATTHKSHPTLNKSGFNPRARAGRDFIREFMGRDDALFQSTRPRGARRSRLILIGIRHCFNPRARAGRDVQHAVAPDAANDVSIHAPARGATYFTPFWSSRIVSFNPRARAGRDHLIVKVNPLK